MLYTGIGNHCFLLGPSLSHSLSLFLVPVPVPVLFVVPVPFPVPFLVPVPVLFIDKKEAAVTVGSGGMCPGNMSARGVYLPGGYTCRGCTCLGSVPAQGVCIPACTEADTPLPHL